MTKRGFSQTKKLSTILGVALEDIKKVNKMKGYEIDMSRYYYHIHKTCYACLAGSVMVSSFKETSKDDEHPEKYGDRIERRLTAIDALRNLEFRMAIIKLDVNRCIFDGDTVLTKEELIKVVNIQRFIMRILDLEEFRIGINKIKHFTDFDTSVKFYYRVQEALEGEGL